MLKIDHDYLQKKMGNLIFLVRWLLYPINLGLVAALCFYVLQFIHDDVVFIYNSFHGYFQGSEERDVMETLMVALLGFVDASMVANLIIMIVQGGHEIFIQRFDVPDEKKPQYLAHMDTGIMKIKVALSISSITLVQILKDFVNLEHIDWETAMHRIVIHMVALISALVMAIIWRISHPSDHHASSETVPAAPSHNTHGDK